MKSRWFATLRAAAVCSLVVLISCAQAPPEFLQNLGFEDSPATPVGWFVDPEASAKGEVAVVDRPVYGGQRALRLSPNSKNQGGPKPLGVGQRISATPYRNNVVSVSAAMAGTAGARAVLGLAALDGSGQVLTQIMLSSGDAPPLKLQTSKGERIRSGRTVSHFVSRGRRPNRTGLFR